MGPNGDVYVSQLESSNILRFSSAGFDYGTFATIPQSGSTYLEFAAVPEPATWAGAPGSAGSGSRSPEGERPTDGAFPPGEKTAPPLRATP